MQNRNLRTGAGHVQWRRQDLLPLSEALEGLQVRGLEGVREEGVLLRHAPDQAAGDLLAECREAARQRQA